MRIVRKPNRVSVDLTYEVEKPPAEISVGIDLGVRRVRYCPRVATRSDLSKCKKGSKTSGRRDPSCNAHQMV